MAVCLAHHETDLWSVSSAAFALPIHGTDRNLQATGLPEPADHQKCVTVARLHPCGSPSSCGQVCVHVQSDVQTDATVVPLKIPRHSTLVDLSVTAFRVELDNLMKYDTPHCPS